MIPVLTILTNYTHVFFPLAGFILMLRGLRIHANTVPQSIPSAARSGERVIQSIGLTFLIAVAYIWLVFTNPNRQFPLTPDSPASYYLSDPMLVLTIIFPLLTSWALGIFVALETNHRLINLGFGGRAKPLMNGILLIIFSSILLQLLLSLGSSRLLALGTGGILLLIYIFVGMQATGYFLLAKGTKTIAYVSSK